MCSNVHSSSFRTRPGTPRPCLRTRTLSVANRSWWRSAGYDLDKVAPSTTSTDEVVPPQDEAAVVHHAKAAEAASAVEVTRPARWPHEAEAQHPLLERLSLH